MIPDPAVRKKLIEVALPLEAINVASAREKSIRHGHPSTLHLWWARRPLAAARAVIFSQMVDDPSAYVDTLRSDPKLLRKAEGLLKGRHKIWQEATALLGKAKAAGISAPEPGPEPKVDDILAEIERQRLFRIIEELVKWENTTNEEVLQRAREEIWQSWRRTCAENAGHPNAKELFDRHKLPAFHDPFAGGGALPLEAQRLGLESYASDLNPVAVLINRAMIELPPKFAGKPPVNPGARVGQLGTKTWKGVQGMAEDIRYYGHWMREEAAKRIGQLYPPYEISVETTAERTDLRASIGEKFTVIAWLWSRTVKSPNPAFRDVDVPLASTFMLCAKPGKEVYVEPIIENGGYRFKVQIGIPKDAAAAKAGTKLSRGANFRCVMSGTPIDGDYIKAEANAGRMRARLMAVVAEGKHGRVYLPPSAGQEAVAKKAKPDWKPDLKVPTPCHDVDRLPMYGMPTWGDAFMPRQLVSLTTLSGLVTDAIELIRRDAAAAGLSESGVPLRNGGTGSAAYAEAVAVYLAFALDKVVDRGSSFCRWDPTPTQSGIINAFSRQALPMTWDFAESNPLGDASGNYESAVDLVAKALQAGSTNIFGHASQQDAGTQSISARKVISTDPPYYDNIGYADLSDFFYVWLRHSLKPVFPDLFATVGVPKAEELVATPYRHGGKNKAEVFFLKGMTRAMSCLSEQSHPMFPVTIYYAFKQAESDGADGTTNTGWDTFLAAVIEAGFSISGTWPIRTELSNRMIGSGTNALASSIVLVCRCRPPDAATATRREFVGALQLELPEALRHLQAGNIAPVDLAQAAIGPGMAVFTRYARVLDAQGKSLSVREALALINETLDIVMAEQEGDFDADSRWALAWFEQFGFEDGEYGVAETLSKAKNTSLSGLVQAGILNSARGKVRLLKSDELPKDWEPATDARLTNWETVHHLIRVLTSGGEGAAAELVTKLGVKAEPARELAYRLYTLCERKKRAGDALAYNGLVQSWPELLRLAEEGGKAKVAKQVTMFEEEGI